MDNLISIVFIVATVVLISWGIILIIAVKLLQTTLYELKCYMGEIARSHNLYLKNLPCIEYRIKSMEYSLNNIDEFVEVIKKNSKKKKQV